MSYVLIALVVCVLIFAKMALVIIPQSETKIVERLGRYYATLNPGINVIIPFIDRAKEIVTMANGRYLYTSRIDLREQVFDFARQNVITKDNIQMEINALLYFQIVDPFKAVYEINNLPNAIEKLTQTTLRNIIGDMELDQTLTSRDIINTKLRAVLDDATNKWGIKVNRVELQDIIPPASVLQAMEKQMQAERDAGLRLTLGQENGLLLLGLGTVDFGLLLTLRLKDLGLLRALRVEDRITEAVGKTTNPANYLLAKNYIAMMKEVASGDKAKTVFLPYEASNLMGSLGGIKELFNQ